MRDLAQLSQTLVEYRNGTQVVLRSQVLARVLTETWKKVFRVAPHGRIIRGRPRVTEKLDRVFLSYPSGIMCPGTAECFPKYWVENMMSYRIYPSFGYSAPYTQPNLGQNEHGGILSY